MLLLIKTNSMWKYITSLKITVSCLLILFILTAWGTYYQSEYGLYAAQNKFFYSFFFLAGGFFPFPGAQLVLWVLSINLLADALSNFKRRSKRLGIFFIHWGIITLLFGSFVTYYFAEESYLALYEGEESNVSTDYRDWEIAAWIENKSGNYLVSAYRLNDLQTGTEIYFKELNIRFKVLNYFENARVRAAENSIAESFSGIDSLFGIKKNFDPANDLPGVVIEMESQQPINNPEANPQDSKRKIILWANEAGPFLLERSADGNPVTISLQIRRISYPLPVVIKLENFTKENYQGIGIVKNYESVVEIKDDDIKRKVRIYMNNPFRYDDLTFYQSSYAIDPDGRERTVLAVVKNAGRLLPYISSGIIFFGLAFHFLTILINFVSRRLDEN